MRAQGLVGVHRRTGRTSLTSQDPMASVPPDLLGRDFTAFAPDLTWTADVTYVPTDQGWLYLAVALDLFSRRIVGWAIAGHMPAEPVCEAVGTAGRPAVPTGGDPPLGEGGAGRIQLVGVAPEQGSYGRRDVRVRASTTR